MMTSMSKRVTMALLALLAGASVIADAVAAGLSLDPVFTDHMVVQRDKDVRVSGTAEPGATVTAAFTAGGKASAKAGADGRFLLVLPPVKAGGPYELTIASGAEKRVLADVLVGDIWLCSGQSNMEFTMWDSSPFYRLPGGDKVIAAAKDRRLRLYKVPRATSPTGRCTDIAGKPVWHLGTDPKGIGPFSAVGYLFGCELRKSLAGDIPVGIVEAAWGGTLIEPWIPLEGYEAAGDQEAIVETIRAYLDPGKDVQVARKRAQEIAQRATENWVDRVLAESNPKVSADALANWAKPDADLSGWRRMKAGTDTRLIAPGVAWYRFDVTLPASWEGEKAVVHLDFVNDSDQTFFDGVKVGATDCRTPNYWKCARDYPIVAKAGRRTVAIRAINYMGMCKFGKKMCVRNLKTGEEVAFGQGEWLERVEFFVDAARFGVRPEGGSSILESCAVPSTLFNAMIAPLTTMNLAGFLWYQGCSNAKAPDKYRRFERIQIDSWRKEFRDPTLPFLVTQLSAFQAHRPKDRLPDDFWKALEPAQCVGYGPIRAVQLEVLDLPHAGVACTIDVGDHSDIHPGDKWTVAKRLAHEALRLKYGRTDLLPGPRGESVVREGASLIVRVRDLGEGLEAHGGKPNPHLFAVATETGVFEWANAELRPDGTIRVWSDKVAEPARVQYCYQGFPPAANIFRKGDGLPLFPFSLSAAR